MPNQYDEIRIALSRRFSLDNLRAITNLCLESLQEGNSVHPAILLTIAGVARWIADAWDDVAIAATTAERVEALMRPHLEALLGLTKGDAATVCARLDKTASAFAEAIRTGLDSELT